MFKSRKGKLAARLASVMLALVVLAAGPLPRVSAAGPSGAKVHPLIAQMAAKDPNQPVRVIVRGKGGGDKVGAKVESKGGKTEKKFSMVNGVAAEMSAKKAVELAEDGDVNWVTIDAPMRSTVNPDNLRTAYPLAVDADDVWRSTPYTGKGIRVAVLDSGVNSSSEDLKTGDTNRVTTIQTEAFPTNSADQYGHGTHVAGIIAGDGSAYYGRYIGIAPDARILSLKVADSHGMAYLSNVISALEWVVKNRARYNIRVINLSLVSSIAESYKTNPLNAAVEIAWLSGIVVVASAGNSGANTMLYAPANDPFVITVGAVDNNSTAGISDDVIPAWSSYGRTQDGFSKPEVVAPGRRIVSLIPTGSELAKLLPDRLEGSGRYLRLSGTSMAAPVVSGAAALILEAHPTWTPDQVKSALMTTARPIAGGASGKGQISALKALGLTSPSYANKGIALNNGVSGVAGVSVYDSATWDSATWDSATWDSATWDSATWDSATWDSATWDSATWDSATWDSNGSLD